MKSMIVVLILSTTLLHTENTNAGQGGNLHTLAFNTPGYSVDFVEDCGKKMCNISLVFKKNGKLLARKKLAAAEFIPTIRMKISNSTDNSLTLTARETGDDGVPEGSGLTELQAFRVYLDANTEGLFLVENVYGEFIRPNWELYALKKGKVRRAWKDGIKKGPLSGKWEHFSETGKPFRLEYQKKYISKPSSLEELDIGSPYKCLIWNSKKGKLLTDRKKQLYILHITKPKSNISNEVDPCIRRMSGAEFFKCDHYKGLGKKGTCIGNIFTDENKAERSKRNAGTCSTPETKYEFEIKQIPCGK